MWLPISLLVIITFFIFIFSNILNITWGSYLWLLYFFLLMVPSFFSVTKWLKHKWCDTKELKMQTFLCISKMAQWYKLNWIDFLIWYIDIELNQFEIASVVRFYQGTLYSWIMHKKYRVFSWQLDWNNVNKPLFFPEQFFKPKKMK